MPQVNAQNAPPQNALPQNNQAVSRTVQGADGKSVVITNTSRIVTAGGAVTEIVFALGMGGNVVATDLSSTFPEQVRKLPQIGYWRTLAAEGLLSMKPTLIILPTEAGPPNVIEQLKASGVPVLVVPSEYSADGAKEKIRRIAQALGKEKEAAAVIQQLETDIATAKQLVSRTTSRPRVLSIYARGAKTMLISGKKTLSFEMVQLAGGVNAVTEFDGTKPVTAEAVVGIAPEVLLMTTHGAESLGGTAQAITAIPGMELTPAGKNKRVVTVDDLALLGFGPRMGKALIELTQELHPELVAKKQVSSPTLPVKAAR
ncbi:MAG: hemin ABC transporter substrate-binding protein [Candidatus Kapaibacterium sp.]|nr:MAG: hemin ABC transporter substrate-binding protein [Candidatus Kapabacteria bacterium]